MFLIITDRSTPVVMDRAQSERHYDKNVDVQDYKKLQRQIQDIHDQMAMMQTGSEPSSVPYPTENSGEYPVKNRQSFMDLQAYRHNDSF